MLVASLKLTKWAYRLGAIFLVLAALYLSLAFWLLPQVSVITPRLEAYLAGRLNAPVQIAALTGRMDSFTPIIEVQGLQAGKGLSIAKATLKPDLLSWLRTGRMALHTVDMSGVWMQLSELDSAFRMPGALASEARTQGFSLNNRRILDLVYSLGAVDFSDVNIIVSPRFSGEFVFHFPQVSVAASEDQRSVQAQLFVASAEHQTAAEFRLNMTRSNFTSTAKGYFRFDDVVLNELGELLPSEQLTPGDVSMGGELWFGIRNDRLVDWQANVRLPRLNWRHQQGASIKADNLGVKLNWQRQPSGWRLDANLESPNQALPSQVSAVRRTRQLEVTADSLDLASVSDLINAVRRQPVLQAHQPTGKLENLRFIYASNPQTWQLAGDLNQVSWQAHGGVPGANRMSGKLWTDGQMGLVELDAQAAGLSIPTMFSGPWQGQNIRGQVGWWQQGGMTNLLGRGLEIDQGERMLTGDFHAVLGKAREARFSLSMAASSASEQDLAAFIPNFANLSTAKRWLTERVETMQADRTQLAMSVALSTPGQGNFWLASDVTEAKIRYHDDWPLAADVSGQVLVTPHQTRIEVGDMSWHQLSGVSGDLVIDHGLSNISMNAEVATDSEPLWAAVQSTPLADMAGDELASWQLSGPAQLALRMQLPLNDPQALSTNVDLGLSQAQLTMPNQRMSLSELTGNLQIDQQTGVGGALSARAFGGPVSLSLTPVFEQGLLADINLAGQADLESVADWLAMPSIIDGQTAYQAQVTVAPDQVRLQLDSDLQGVSVDMPAPLHKPAEEAWPLTVAVQTGDFLKINANINDQLASEIHLHPERMDGAVAYGQALPDSWSEDGIAILATTAELDVQQWWQWLNENIAGQASGMGNNPISEIVINSDRAVFAGIEVHDPRLILRQSTSRWSADLRSREIVGLIGISDDPQTPFQVALNLLNIELPDPESGATGDPWSAIDPSHFPPMQVEIQRLALDGEDIGSWRAVVDPIEQGVALSDVSGVMRGVEVSGSGCWLKTDDGHQTSAEVNLRTTSLADVLTNFDQPRLLDSRSANMVMDFQWPSSPIALDFADVVGTVNFDLIDGTIYQVENLEGIKMFGLLNMTRVLNRLALDFSDIISPGLTYDQIQGDIVFANGYASVGDSMTFDSASVFIGFDGGFSLVTEQLDADAQVSMPITSAIPVAVFLAGVSPQVAGLLFITERIINEQLIRRAWIRYLLTGSLNDINFQVYPARVSN